ncbi:FtsH protease activity modulator HflK [Pararobbsia alpina]|nr:FtsH protease activity modulator HflK [Pararobbsia alpina]
MRLVAWAMAMLAMNDPRGGGGGGGPGGPGSRGPQGGPPDLDELWRDFNRRLSRLFSGKGNGSGAPQRPSHARRNLSLIVVGVLIAVWIGNGVFVVPDGQAGVVLRFGQYQNTVPAGVQWHLPFPIESDEIVNVTEVRSVDIGRLNVVPGTNMKDASMLTRDGDIVDVRFTVQFRVSDAKDFLFNNVDPESAVTQAAQVAARELVGKRPLTDVLGANRAELATQLNAAIQASLDRYKTGIALVGVTVQSTQPPEQVQAAFADAAKAAQDSDKVQADARVYANSILPGALGDAAKTIEQAEGYKQRVVTEAQGNADRFTRVLAEYQKAPAVTRERMYIETMQQIYTNATKVLIDSKGGNTVYLPLDKLLAQNGVGPKADAAPGAAAPAAVAPPAVTPGAGASAPASNVPAGASTGANAGASDAGNAANSAASPAISSSGDPAVTVVPDAASAAAPASNASSGDDRAQLFRSREDSKDIR